ncbi:MAG: hypothetical protein CL843_15280 [Crocinitomicaceae bacterium]|nr:hypothetical protein [Crocinitomicaceae bacterium]
MKKNYLHPLSLMAIFILSSFFAQAQDFDDGVTLKLGLVNNLGDFGEVNHADRDYDYNNGISSISHNGSGAGISFEWGKYWYFNGIDLGNDMAVGLDVSFIEFNFAVSNHTAAYSELGYYNETDFNIFHLYVGPKVGPMFSYSPISELTLDASLKFQILAGSLFGAYDMEYSDGYTETEGVIGYGLGFRFTPGVYVRYRQFLAGIEFNIGNTNGSAAYSATDESSSGSMPTSNAKLAIGFKFN